MVFRTHKSDPDRDLGDSASDPFASPYFDSRVPVYMSEANSARLEQTESISYHDCTVGAPYLAVSANYQDYPDREYSWDSFGASPDSPYLIGNPPDLEPQILWPDMIHASTPGIEPLSEEFTPWIPSSASSASYFSESPHSSVGWCYDTSNSAIQKRKPIRAMEPVNGNTPFERMSQITPFPPSRNENVNKDSSAPDITIDYLGDPTSHPQSQRDPSE